MKPSVRLPAVVVPLALAANAGIMAAQAVGRPAWLVVDTAARTATIAIEVTAPPGSASALLNGFRDGRAQVVVPVGWTIRWSWVSKDNTALHSLVVGPEREKLPDRAQAPAFPNAMTRSALNGLPAGRRDDTAFDADQSGWYWLYCGVPEHALRGEWIGLRVRAQATKPEVVVKGKEAP